jgi:hypothetical protein
MWEVMLVVRIWRRGGKSWMRYGGGWAEVESSPKLSCLLSVYWDSISSIFLGWVFVFFLVLGALVGWIAGTLLVRDLVSLLLSYN